MFYYNNRPFFLNNFSDYKVVRRYASSEGLFTDGDKSGYSFNKKGESYVFDATSFNTKNFLESIGATVVKREVLSKTEIIYAYTDEIKVFKNVFNSKVNIHIAISNGEIKVGIPFIYDSF